MSIRDLQAQRDQLELGDEVLIAKGPHQYRGIILEFVGMMAKVRLARGSKVEVHSVARLSKVIDTEQLLPPPPAPRTRTPRDELPSADWNKRAIDKAADAIASHTRAVVAEVIPIGEITPKQDDMQAWLDMGVALVGQMRREIDELNAERERVLADGKEMLRLCVERADELGREADAKQKKLDLLTKIAKR